MAVDGEESVQIVDRVEGRRRRKPQLVNYIDDVLDTPGASAGDTAASRHQQMVEVTSAGRIASLPRHHVPHCLFRCCYC